MRREELLSRVQARKANLGLTIDNIAKLSRLGNRTVTRFFAGEDVKLSTVEKITNLLGLDFAGNEVIDIDTLKEKRATHKALYIISLVQDTSALEKQGLEDSQLNLLIQEIKEQFLHGEYRRNLWAS
jgi:transcriptional regulator with XRE-family HTH domain